MIEDRQQLRHITHWTRSPALELTLLIPQPGVSGDRFLAIAAPALGLEGFWQRPRQLRNPANAREFADDHEYPVVAVIPRTGAAGLVGVNVLHFETATIAPDLAELLIYIPLDIFELCWDVQFLGSSIEDLACMFAEVAGWAWSLRPDLRVQRAFVAFEGLIETSATGKETELPAEDGLWIEANMAQALGWNGPEHSRGLRRVHWGQVGADCGRNSTRR